MALLELTSRHAVSSRMRTSFAAKKMPRDALRAFSNVFDIFLIPCKENFPHTSVEMAKLANS